MLVDGFASALQESLTDSRQAEAASVQSGEAQQPTAVLKVSEDTATLILRLLLRAAYNPGPNFAHLLLGFDIDDGVQG